MMAPMIVLRLSSFAEAAAGIASAVESPFSRRDPRHRHRSRMGSSSVDGVGGSPGAAYYSRGPRE